MSSYVFNTGFREAYARLMSDCLCNQDPAVVRAATELVRESINHITEENTKSAEFVAGWQEACDVVLHALAVGRQ